MLESRLLHIYHWFCVRVLFVTDRHSEGLVRE